LNILFVCSRNKWRSRTAETLFRNNGLHQISSAGTEASARRKVNQKLLDWADLIFVMEKKHQRRIQDNFLIESANDKIVVLGIPDAYKYMDEELIDILKEAINPYL
jgi:protein-tyrosine phosphatase